MNDTTRLVWQTGKHIPQLDGIRGLAILVVTLYRFAKELPREHALGRNLAQLFHWGDRGVDLFFVLSGFLITGLLIDAKSKPHCFRNFLIRRSLRIFPLYFGSLALLLAINAWVPSFRGIFSQAEENQIYLWTYLTNVKMSVDASWCFGYLDHFWSLAVEEHFYVIWPCVVLFVPKNRLLKIAVLVASLAALARILFAIGSANGVAPDVFSFFRFDALLIGAALAAAVRVTLILSHGQFLGGGVLIASVCVGTGLAVAGGRIATLPHTVWAFLWAGLLLFTISSSQSTVIAKLLGGTVLRWLGKYSYAMYVFQSPLIPLTAASLSVASLTEKTGSVNLAIALYIPVMFTLTVGAALLSWYVVERRVLALKRYFPMAETNDVPQPTVIDERNRAGRN